MTIIQGDYKNSYQNLSFIKGTLIIKITNVFFCMIIRKDASFSFYNFFSSNVKVPRVNRKIQNGGYSAEREDQAF